MFSNKQSESFPGRSYYHGSGVDWPRFLPWLLVAFIVAAILAEVMAELFRIGHYYILIVPLVAAAAVGGMISLAVNRGHCRSSLVAGLAGFCAGVFLYLGYFYCGMIHDFGAEVAVHPEVFPKYIQIRMMIERTRDVHDTGHEDDEKSASPDSQYFNWGRFGLELIVVVAVTTGMGLKRARKPYCETCRRWMTREMTPFEPTGSTELLEALRTSSPRSLAALCAKAPYSTIPNVTLAVDFCPNLKEGISRDCPVYVSLKEIKTAPKGTVLDPFEQSKGKLLVSNLQLNSDELAALAPRFKVFEAVAGRSAVTALLPTEDTAETFGDKGVVYADITTAPSESAGKVMSRKNVVVASLFSFGILLGFFGGLGLLIWGLVTAFPDNPPVGGVSPEAKRLGVVLMAAGGGWFLVSIAIGLIDSSLFSNRYIRKLLLKELGRRTSVLVDVNDPDALFVEYVPKTNWGKMMLDNASDVGLMVVDRQKKEIRFEGDKERWRIPAAAITYCEFEVFVRQQGHASSKIFFAVVRANHRAGFWEAPIRPRGKLGLFSGGRKKATKQLFDAIEAIRGVSQEAVTR